MVNPVVSVIVPTFRHERFLTQAVEIVVAQKTDFPVEILITEDCSPDRTRAIACGFQHRYPDRVRLFLSPANQNDNEVITRAWKGARGRYIAYLDGDDYWTEPRKLETQIDFLERHPEVFVCGHTVTTVNEDGHEVGPVYPAALRRDRFVSREDLAWEYPFPFLSVVFRNNGIMPPLESFNTVFNADSYLCGFFANFGSGYMFARPMGAYRLHGGGAWSTLDHRSAADCRNATLSRIPPVLSRSLRGIAYARLLAHSVREDYSWPRRVRQIPPTFGRMLASLTPKAAAYLAARVSGTAWQMCKRNSRTGTARYSD